MQTNLEKIPRCGAYALTPQNRPNYDQDQKREKTEHKTTIVACLFIRSWNGIIINIFAKPHASHTPILIRNFVKYGFYRFVKFQHRNVDLFIRIQDVFGHKNNGSSVLNRPNDVFHSNCTNKWACSAILAL